MDNFSDVSGTSVFIRFNTAILKKYSALNLDPELSPRIQIYLFQIFKV